MKMLRVIFLLTVASSSLMAQLIFQGLVEQSDINKNTFLCPGSASDGIQGCRDTQSAAHGFDVSGGRTIQFCNNQQYWLQQEAVKAQYISTVRNYTGAELQQKLQNEGWKAMGGYAVVITTDPLLVNFIMPEVVAGSGQIKVIVQLWYNGSDLIQLWSQDAAVLADGTSFQVTLSSAIDSRLPGLFAGATTTTPSWQTTFLSKLDIQPNNRQASDYNGAAGSPRHVRITPS